MHITQHKIDGRFWLGLFYMLFLCSNFTNAQHRKSNFKVIAFYTVKNDLAHISFVHEANMMFPEMAAKYHFMYDSTQNWNNLNAKFLANYQVVLFFRYTAGRTETPRSIPPTHGKWRCLDGVSFFGFCLNAFCLSPKLGLVP